MLVTRRDLKLRLYQAIGAHVVELRVMRGWTVLQLARAVDLTPSQIAKIERGTAGCPLDALVDIARVFGVTVDYLIGGAPFRGSSKEEDSREEKFR